MQYVILKKERFNEFIANLKHHYKVMAPVDKGYNQYAFAEVDSGEDIALGYLPTILPPKKYFMPQYEKILEYAKGADGKVAAVVEYEDIVLFGVHTCDLAGIQCLNIAFSDTPKDDNYLIRKKHVGIIGLECLDYCDEYASCKLMDNHMPNGGYDLFFTDLGDAFMVHVNTLLGDEMVKAAGCFDKAAIAQHKQLEDVRAKKRETFKNEVDIEHQQLAPMFDKSYDSDVWQDLGNRCLACGNCTNVCPTCYCFDISDELNLDLKTGQRTRRWDSCQHETFAEVAGGESFREHRADRQRHRYFRKFKYPVEKYYRYFCTGCGRCSRTCMAEINLKETLKALVKENA